MDERAASRAVRLSEGFSDLATQERAVRFGMWIFLASETLLFGALFGLYSAYRVIHGEAFLEAADHNSVTIGTINTFVLITSSFFVAWALHAVERGRRRTCILSLAAVVMLGLTFLTLKAFEYHDHLSQGIAPGSFYSFAELSAPGATMFFTLYYVMTGLHALHVVVGISLMLWLIVRAYRRRIRFNYHPELELSGLYWHLVDVIWIFLWPLLYLTG